MPSFCRREEMWSDTVETPSLLSAFQIWEKICSLEKACPGLLANRYRRSNSFGVRWTAWPRILTWRRSGSINSSLCSMQGNRFPVCTNLIRFSLRNTALRSASISFRSTGNSTHTSAPWPSISARSVLLENEEAKMMYGGGYRSQPGF